MNAAPGSRPGHAGGDGAAGALSGVRVVELGILIAGPFAGRLLADMGADVIKVEAPGQLDPLREWGHATYRGRSLWWPVQTRNKRCITLDVRKPRGRELLLELVSRSDVVLENFRPGTLERWGLGFDELQDANPRIIMARISGYGQSGPYANRAGFAAAAEALGGLRHLNGFPGEPPPRNGISLGDSLAAMFAVQGVLAALYARDVLGTSGQVVDVALSEACFALLESAVPEYDLLGHVRGPGGTGLDGLVGAAPSNLFQSRDRRWLVVAANHDRVFSRLCDALGTPELAEDPRFATTRARSENREECEALIADWVSKRDAKEVVDVLSEAGVACAPVYTVADIVRDLHFRERGMLVEHADPELGTFLGAGIVPKLSETPGSVRWTGPWQPGHDNGAVFGGLLGIDEGEFAELHGAEVI
jgi:formyl-CoA transferase